MAKKLIWQLAFGDRYWHISGTGEIDWFLWSNYLRVKSHLFKSTNRTPPSWFIVEGAD